MLWIYSPVWMSSNDLKRRIEEAYETSERRTIETGVEMGGQMTIAFCGGHHGDRESSFS